MGMSSSSVAEAFERAGQARSLDAFVEACANAFDALDWKPAARVADWAGRAADAAEPADAGALWRSHCAWSPWRGSGSDWAPASARAFELDVKAHQDAWRPLLPRGSYFLTRFEDALGPERPWAKPYGLEWALADEGGPRQRRSALDSLVSAERLRAAGPAALEAESALHTTASEASTRVAARWVCRSGPDGALMAARLPVGEPAWERACARSAQWEPRPLPTRQDASFLPPGAARGEPCGSEADLFARAQALGVSPALSALGLPNEAERLARADEAIAEAVAGTVALDLAELAEGGAPGRSPALAPAVGPRVAKALHALATPRQAGLLATDLLPELERVLGVAPARALSRALGKKGFGHGWEPADRRSAEGVLELPALPEQAILGSARGSFRAVRADGEVGPSLDESELSARMAIGEIGAGTPLWTSGLAQWKSACEIPSANALLERAALPRWRLALPEGASSPISSEEFARRACAGAFDDDALCVRSPEMRFWAPHGEQPELAAIKRELVRPRWTAKVGQASRASALSARGLASALAARPGERVELTEAGGKRSLALADSPLAARVALWARDNPLAFRSLAEFAARRQDKVAASVPARAAPPSARPLPGTLPTKPPLDGQW